jgi:chromosome segregation ATPase
VNEEVQKRASHLLVLEEEKNKLNDELKAMSKRLEAAEQKQNELQMKQGSNRKPINPT